MLVDDLPDKVQGNPRVRIGIVERARDFSRT